MARVKLPEGVWFYTVAEVARYLRVAPMTVYRMVHSGELKSLQLNERVYRIPVKAFHEWLEANE